HVLDSVERVRIESEPANNSTRPRRIPTEQGLREIGDDELRPRRRSRRDPPAKTEAGRVIRRIMKPPDLRILGRARVHFVRQDLILARIDWKISSVPSRIQRHIVETRRQHHYARITAAVDGHRRSAGSAWTRQKTEARKTDALVGTQAHVLGVAHVPW